MKFLAILKGSVVVFAFLLGAVFIGKGIGLKLPWVEYGTLKAYDLPAGSLLLACGVLLAIFWRPRATVNVKTTITNPGGPTISTTTKTDYRAGVDH